MATTRLRPTLTLILGKRGSCIFLEDLFLPKERIVRYWSIKKKIFLKPLVLQPKILRTYVLTNNIYLSFGFFKFYISLCGFKSSLFQLCPQLFIVSSQVVDLCFEIKWCIVSTNQILRFNCLQTKVQSLRKYKGNNTEVAFCNGNTV